MPGGKYHSLGLVRISVLIDNTPDFTVLYNKIAFGMAGPLHLPFPCAAKTGTTKDFRDNWTIGYTTDYTVGVWVGNFDGKPMRHISGITGAAPLFRDIMLTLHRKNDRSAYFEISLTNDGFKPKLVISKPREFGTVFGLK